MVGSGAAGCGGLFDSGLTDGDLFGERVGGDGSGLAEGVLDARRRMYGVRAGGELTTTGTDS
jgi:hypothetical protein